MRGPIITLVAVVLIAGIASAQTSTLDVARKKTQEKNYKAARAELEAIVAKEPKNGSALHELARCTRQLGDLDASIAAAKQALAIPFQPRISRLELAKSFAMKGADLGSRNNGR